jgi:hypothetical protein
MRVLCTGLVTEVAAPEATLRWLRDFLAPSEERAACAVRLRVDAAAYAGLAAGEPAGEVPCFTRDGEFKSLSLRSGGALVMDDVRVALVVRGGEVEVVAEEEGYPARLALLRAVRELATTAALRNGWLHLHAAAVEVRGSVVAFAGPRRTGKSTLLLHALLRGARFVGNDRLFLEPGGFAWGVPTLVRLREDSLALFPSLAEKVRGYDRRRSLAEAAPEPPEHSFGRSVSPAQLCACTGATASCGGPLRAVYFPVLDPAPGFGVEPLPVAEAARRLFRSLFLASLPERPAAAFGPAPSRDRAALDALCASLAGRVPCFALRLGPDAYERDVWAAL